MYTESQTIISYGNEISHDALFVSHQYATICVTHLLIHSLYIVDKWIHAITFSLKLVTCHVCSLPYIPQCGPTPTLFLFFFFLVFLFFFVLVFFPWLYLHKSYRSVSVSPTPPKKTTSTCKCQIPEELFSRPPTSQKSIRLTEREAAASFCNRPSRKTGKRGKGRPFGRGAAKE